MNFDFSEEQRTIQEQARTMLAKECPATRVREQLNDDATGDIALWKKMVELGWPAIAIAEEHGGLGLSYLELCVIAEELGRSLAPVPFIASVYLGTELIKLAASADQQARWLPGLATGETVATVALEHYPLNHRTQELSLIARGDRLNGTVNAVLHGTLANTLIALVQDEHQQPALFHVDLNQAGVERKPQKSLDPSLPLAQLCLQDVHGTRLQGEPPLDQSLSTLLDRVAVLLGFEQVGGCEAAIDMAKAYTAGRYAFGRQVASFQAIKHKVADMFVAKELAKSNAYYGAWAMTAGEQELPLAAATARVSAIDAYYLCSKENIQAHGGMGFTWEFDCHLYYRRAQLLSTLIGGNPRWKQRLADSLLMA